MTRRTLFKIIALLPLLGPKIAKAMVESDFKAAVGHKPYLPANFPKWSQAIDGLEDAGKWALAIERSRLPNNIIFPCAGQIWETIRDCDVDFFPRPANLLWAPQANPSVLRKLARDRIQLRRHERIRILRTDDKRPLFVMFVPVRYDELHESIVAHEIRSLPGYLGYELQVKTARTIADFNKESCQTYFNEAFRLIRDTV
jgi:hypothetical protein